MPEDELHLSIDGLNMDAIYESFVRQIAGDKLQTDSSESLKESVERVMPMMGLLLHLHLLADKPFQESL